MQGQKAVEIYLGKWMNVSGPISNIYGNRKGVSVALGLPVTLRTIFDPEVLSTVWLSFSQDVEQVEALQPGDTLTAVGKLEEVTPSSISLSNCEYVNAA